MRERAELALWVAREWFKLEPTVTSAYRSWEDQQRLYDARQRELACRAATGKADCGIQSYPVNVPGDSAHNFGFAFDSVVPASSQALWDIIREAVGFRVPANDRIHAEVPDWRRYK